MGLLDDVIGAALGAGSQPGAKSGSGSVLSSPIAMALMALLASKMMPAAGGQQGAGGGLGGLLEQLQKAGLGQAVNSWIGSGPNQPVSPSQLRQALGQDTVEELADQTGLPHDDLLAQLSRILPGVVDQLTPNGRIPSQSDLLAGPR
jgi:uncharacterized protein YidB (DUF937 family)